MKFFWLIFFAGSIFYYLIVRAFKLDVLTLEMVIHTLYHFLSGFIVLAGWFYFYHKKKFTSLLILVIAILAADEIYDYFKNLPVLSLELLLFNLYLMFWGALCGMTFINHWMHSMDKEFED